MSSSVSTSAINKYCGFTEVETEQFSYEWRIKNFRLLPEKNGECMFSPGFRVKKDGGVTWKLQLYPRGYEEVHIAYVSLFLYLDSKDVAKKGITVDCKLSIEKSANMASKCYSFVDTYKTLGGKGTGQMIGRSELVKPSSADDTIIIRCEVNVAQRTISKSLDPVSLDLQKGQLSEHFSQLFNDLRFCDVSIIVATEKFPAHKVVLAARSTVFAAMFEHNEMEENRKNEVKIEDLEPATVQRMLEFLYTDKVTDLETLAHELLRASDKYDLHRLRIMCEEVICESLTIDNAAEILVLSDLYHSDNLREYVTGFIDDHLSSVIKSDSYKTMVETFPALLGGLVSLIAMRRELKE